MTIKKSPSAVPDINLKHKFYVGGAILSRERLAVGDDYLIDGDWYLILSVSRFRGWTAVKLKDLDKDFAEVVFIPQWKLLPILNKKPIKF